MKGLNYNKLSHIRNLMMDKKKCRIFTRYPLGEFKGIFLVITCPQYEMKWEAYLEYENEDLINTFDNDLSFGFLERDAKDAGR
jgi:hypothetical protein